VLTVPKNAYVLLLLLLLWKAAAVRGSTAGAGDAAVVLAWLITW
jgi:hypothetical protein